MKGIKIHDKSDFAKMRASGKLAAEILDYIADFVKVGVSTDELNQLCHEKILAAGAKPAPLYYPDYAAGAKNKKNFPKSICTSVNNVICHGIPGGKNKDILKNGDILNIDVTVIVDGWHGDTSRMYYVGDVAPEAKKLCQVTYDAMMLGIREVRPGTRISAIGRAIQSYAESQGFSVVRDYCGHGIGKIFHDAPNILHYFEEGKNDNSVILEEGMFFTIEPMINAGSHKTVLNKNDYWTVSTTDGSWSAQFEHTIAVTKNGFEIFTQSPTNKNFPPY